MEGLQNNTKLSLLPDDTTDKLLKSFTKKYGDLEWSVEREDLTQIESIEKKLQKLKESNSIFKEIHGKFERLRRNRRSFLDNLCQDQVLVDESLSTAAVGGNVDNCDADLGTPNSGEYDEIGQGSKSNPEMTNESESCCSIVPQENISKEIYFKRHKEFYNTSKKECTTKGCTETARYGEVSSVTGLFVKSKCKKHKGRLKGQPPKWSSRYTDMLKFCLYIGWVLVTNETIWIDETKKDGNNFKPKMRCPNGHVVTNK